jgi:hypothetical protein
VEISSKISVSQTMRYFVQKEKFRKIDHVILQKGYMFSVFGERSQNISLRGGN